MYTVAKSRVLLVLLLSSFVSGEQCKCAFDVVQLQDVTQTFTDDLVTMQSLVGPMMKSIGDAFPGSKYGFSVFADKPIPYAGFGDYATYSEWMIKDVCYQRVLPLTTSTFSAQMAIRSLTCSGGNDYAENQLGALVDLANDSGLGWSAAGGPGELPVRVKVVVMLTDALPHAAGDAKLCIDAWNDEWCLPTMNQFNIAWGGCAPDTQYFADCQRLGAQFRQDPNSLKEEDTNAFADVLNYCGPYPFPEPIPNSGKAGQSCIGTEYPTNEVMCKAMIDASIFPVILTSGSNTDLMDYLHDIGTCPPDTHNEGECLARWYEDLFTACGIPGVFQPLSEIEFLPSLIIDALHAIESSICRSPMSVEDPTEEPMKSGLAVNTVTNPPVAPEGEADVSTTLAVPGVTTASETSTTVSEVKTIYTTTSPTAYTSKVAPSSVSSSSPSSTTTAVESPTTAPVDPSTDGTTTPTVYTTTPPTVYTSKSAAITTRPGGGCHSGCSSNSCLCEGEIVMHVKDLELLLQRLIRLSSKNN